MAQLNPQTLQGDLLLVEDDPIVARCVRGLLMNKTPLIPDIVNCVDEGIRLLRRAAAGQGGRVPYVMITDIRLKDEDAERLIGWVRTSAVTIQLPVLAISADDSATMKQLALDAGASDFLSKARVVRDLVPWVLKAVPDEDLNLLFHRERIQKLQRDKNSLNAA